MGLDLRDFDPSDDLKKAGKKLEDEVKGALNDPLKIITATLAFPTMVGGTYQALSAVGGPQALAARQAGKQAEAQAKEIESAIRAAARRSVRPINVSRVSARGQPNGVGSTLLTGPSGLAAGSQNIGSNALLGA